MTWRRAVEAVAVLALLAGSATWRVHLASDGWVMTGADSYGYVKLAESLRQQGRYALGPGMPPQYARLPLYPWFIRVVKGAAPAEHDGGAGWWRIQRAQIVIDLCGTDLLVFFLLRRRVGRAAALTGLAVLAFWPALVGASLAALSETLATFLTTLVVALVAWDDTIGTRRLFAAACVAGVGVLARQDALVLLPMLGWCAVEARPRLRRLAVAVAGVALMMAPWVVRNLVVVGRPHVLGARIDRFGQPVEHWRGFHRWMASWAVDNSSMYAQFCYYDPACRDVAIWLPARAYDDVNDSTKTTALLILRVERGDDASVSDGFAKLADARLKAHPVRVLVWYPLWRAMTLWTGSELWPIKHPETAWTTRRAAPYVAGGLGVAWLIGGALMLVKRRSRRVALRLVPLLVLRTAALAWLYYVESRYLVEILPTAVVVAVIGFFDWRDSGARPV